MTRLSLSDVASMLIGLLIIYFSLTTESTITRSMTIALVCGVICFIPTILKVVGLFTIPFPLLVMVVASVLIHGFGLITDSYSTIPRYDTVSHTLSSATIGVCVFYVMMVVQFLSRGRIDFGAKGTSVMVAFLTMTFSIYWEVMEYVSDLLFGSITQYSPFDTLTDLMCDATGAFLASILIGFYVRGRTADEVIASFDLNPKISALLSGSRDGTDGS